MRKNNLWFVFFHFLIKYWFVFLRKQTKRHSNLPRKLWPTRKNRYLSVVWYVEFGEIKFQTLNAGRIREISEREIPMFLASTSH